MRTTNRTNPRALLALCLLSAPLLPLTWMCRDSVPQRASQTAIPPGRQRTPSEAARSEAWRYWRRAQLAVNDEREGLEAWDSQASSPQGQEVWRRELMARDRSGCLREARAAARRAAELARTLDEACEAALLRTRLECDLGNHEIQFQQAQLLAAWEHQSERSLRALECAALCTGRTAVATAARAVQAEQVSLLPSTRSQDGR